MATNIKAKPGAGSHENTGPLEDPGMFFPFVLCILLNETDSSRGHQFLGWLRPLGFGLNGLDHRCAVYHQKRSNQFQQPLRYHFTLPS